MWNSLFGKNWATNRSVNWIALCNALKHDPIMHSWMCNEIMYLLPLYSRCMRWIYGMNSIFFIFFFPFLVIYSIPLAFCCRLVPICLCLWSIVSSSSSFYLSPVMVFYILLVCSVRWIELNFQFCWLHPNANTNDISFLLLSIIINWNIYGLLEMRSLWLKWICHNIYSTKIHWPQSSILITMLIQYDALVHWYINAPVCIAQIMCKYPIWHSNEFPLCDSVVKNRNYE